MHIDLRHDDISCIETLDAAVEFHHEENATDCPHIAAEAIVGLRNTKVNRGQFLFVALKWIRRDAWRNPAPRVRVHVDLCMQNSLNFDDFIQMRLHRYTNGGFEPGEARFENQQLKLGE